MTVFKRITALFFVLLLSACNTMFAGYSAPPLSETNTQPYQKLITSLTTPHDKYPALINEDCFGAQKSATSTDSRTCQQQRNDALSALVISSADVCLEHRRSIYGREASWNIGLGTATSLFAGAAAVVTSSQAQSILGAFALFTNSERSLLNETIYKQMLVTSVDKKIVEMRDAKMRLIYTSMKLDINQYSIHDGLRDVIDLHNTCSFIDGLQKALEEGTQSTSAVKIMRLKTNLRSANAERSAIGATEATTTQKEYAASLDKRIIAISNELAIEEAK